METKKLEQDCMRGLGALLQDICRATGVTQTELGSVLGLHQPAVHKVLVGKQALNAYHLLQLSKYFGISVQNLLTGEVDLFELRSKFELDSELPEEYQAIKTVKMRYVTPLLSFYSEKLGKRKYDGILKKERLNLLPLLPGDESVSVFVLLNLLRMGRREKLLNHTGYRRIGELFASAEHCDYLDELYRAQKSPIDILRMYAMNHHSYDDNFEIGLTVQSESKVGLVVSPKKHMNNINFRTADLGDSLCHYKKSQIGSIPGLVKPSTSKIVEKKCMFKGERNCEYIVNL